MYVHILRNQRTSYPILNPRYNLNTCTRVTCGESLYKLICQMDAKSLFALDDFLIKHAFNTQHEQMMEEVFKKVYKR